MTRSLPCPCRRCSREDLPSGARSRRWRVSGTAGCGWRSRSTWASSAGGRGAAGSSSGRRKGSSAVPPTSLPRTAAAGRGWGTRGASWCWWWATRSACSRRNRDSTWDACSPSPCTATACGSEASPAWPHSTRARPAGSGHRLFVPLLTAGEPLRGVSGLVETADGELWLNGADGVTRIPAAEVRRALAEPGYQVRYERLDYRDGIEPPAQQVRPLPSAAAGTDGRIWFASAGGVAWVDPHRVRRNTVPPPVQLRALTAGGRRYFAGQSARRHGTAPAAHQRAQRGLHGLQPGRPRPGAIQVPP